MNDFLFTVPESLSPRLKWIRDNKLLTYCSLPGTDEVLWFAGFDTGNYKYQNSADYFGHYCADHVGTGIGEGETEDEAIEILCRKHGVKLWNES